MDWNVSRIQEHNLRSVWENVERDFTRWLTENIDLLASELGIEIEDARAEEAVGDFSADIVAREMNTGETVVIENQYDKTDHDHLGKLLTYSSGKNAGFTMWLAEEFRPEHRSVLEWLNETGPKGAKFFGIKPRVVILSAVTISRYSRPRWSRILHRLTADSMSIEGSEERGFEFEVIVEPNEWEREGSDESLTNSEQSYRQFFAEVVDAYSRRRPNWYKLKPGPQDYLTFSAGISGVRFGWVFHQGPEFSVERYISTSNKERNEEMFEALKREQTQIEESLSVELAWERLPHTVGYRRVKYFDTPGCGKSSRSYSRQYQKQACRIKRPEDIDGTITELTADHQEYLVGWGVDAMDEFQEEFEPRLSALGSN